MLIFGCLSLFGWFFNVELEAFDCKIFIFQPSHYPSQGLCKRVLLICSKSVVLHTVTFYLERSVLCGLWATTYSGVLHMCRTSCRRFKSFAKHSAQVGKSQAHRVPWGWGKMPNAQFLFNHYWSNTGRNDPLCFHSSKKKHPTKLLPRFSSFYVSFF